MSEYYEKVEGLNKNFEKLNKFAKNDHIKNFLEFFNPDGDKIH